jgi:hypothetical protein
MSNNSNNSNNSNSNLGEFETQMLEEAIASVQMAREKHQRALRELGDARKREQNTKKKSRLSKKISRALAGNEINNITNLRRMHNEAKKAGVPEVYGPIYSRQQTPLGRAGEILDAHQRMMNVSRSIKNPSRATTATKSLKRMMGLSSHASNVRSNRRELEAAFEQCEKYGICDNMEEIFDQLADLEDERTNSQRERNSQTAALVASMPLNQLIQRHRGNMLYRDRHQPERLSNSVFYTNNQGRLKSHSISNQRNMRRLYNNNGPRQPVRSRNLPMVKRRKSVKKNRRASL